MNPMQIMRAFRNPQQFMQSMMNNSQVAQNPILKNALDMAKSGNKAGVEEMARNLCKEKGLDADEMFRKIKQQTGI